MSSVFDQLCLSLSKSKANLKVFCFVFVFSFRTYRTESQLSVIIDSLTSQIWRLNIIFERWRGVFIALCHRHDQSFRIVIILSKSTSDRTQCVFALTGITGCRLGEKKQHSNTPTRVHHIKHICIAASPKTLLCVDLHLRKQNVFVEVSVIGSILLFKQEDGCWGWKHDNQLHHLRRSCTVVFLTPVLCADSHRRQKWPDLVWRR